MFYVVTDRGVQVGRSLKELNRKYGILLEPEEMTPLGPDSIVYLNNSDIDFVQDKHRISNIMFGNFFKTDNSGKLLTIVNIILTCTVLFTSCGA